MFTVRHLIAAHEMQVLTIWTDYTTTLTVTGEIKMNCGGGSIHDPNH